MSILGHAVGRVANAAVGSALQSWRGTGATDSAQLDVIAAEGELQRARHLREWAPYVGAALGVAFGIVAAVSAGRRRTPPPSTGGVAGA